MSIKTRWRFTAPMIQDAPDWKGVYVLWSGDVPLAVGHARGGADSVRSRLLAHHSRAASAGMAEVTHYSWELCADPRAREAELAKGAWNARESS